MKPYDLKPGEKFQVSQACNSAELGPVWEVVKIDCRAIDLPLAGTRVVTGITLLVKHADGTVGPLGIGPWVEVERVI